MLLEGLYDELQVPGDDLGGGVFFEIVGPDEQHHDGGIHREDVLLETDQHPAGGVAADAPVGDLDAGEGGAEALAPALGDRVAEEHDRALVVLDLLGPGGATLSHSFWNQS